MTKIEIDLKDVIDYDQLSSAITDSIGYDIHKTNPEWWAEKVCKPMQEDLKKLLEDRELMCNTLAQVVADYVGYDYIRNATDDAISRRVAAVIKDKMKDFDVTITRRLTDYD